MKTVVAEKSTMPLTAMISTTSLVRMGRSRKNVFIVPNKSIFLVRDWRRHCCRGLGSDQRHPFVAGR